VRGTARRELWSRLALLGLGIVFGVLLCEGALRILGWRPERYRTPLVLNHQRKRLLLDCYPENPRGYFPVDLRDAATRRRFSDLPGLESASERAPFAVEFQYNELHFRDREPASKSPGVRRIVLLGDSFTEGQGVREEDTTARVLERRLNEAGPGRYEVRNCGRRGHDFPKLAKAFEKVLPYEPDLLVYAMVPNDPERSASFEAARVEMDDWIVDRRRVADPERPLAPPTGLRLLAFLREQEETRRISRTSTKWYRDLYGPPNAEGWARTEGHLREMQAQLQRSGGRLLVATWPLLVELDAYPFADIEGRVAAFLDQARIRRHDLRSALRGRPAETLWVHPLDRHPNEVAHRIAAESLVPVVHGMLEP
jgi:lysophospholipase L1-like esterase